MSEQRLIHHSDTPYDEAKGKAAEHFTAMLMAQVDAGRKTAQDVLNRVRDEQPFDRIINTRGVEFTVTPKKAVVLQSVVQDGKLSFTEPLHRHALQQISVEAGMPMSYITTLLESEDTGKQLLTHNLNTLLHEIHRPRRLLSRSVKGEIRGVLSDKYRRLDSQPIFESFALACQELGAVPIQGVNGDLRFSIKALLPKVFEPKGEEIMAFGVQLSNSDFGAGALAISTFIERVACTNFMTLKNELRKVHLGSRLSDDITYAEETVTADTTAMALVVFDTIKALLGPEKVNDTVQIIEAAIDQKIDTAEALESLKKRGLLKSEVDSVRDVFNNGGVEELPKGQNAYRMANAISWVAKSSITPERQLALEELAGEVILNAAN